VAAYNAADPQIAATLTLDPIRPYVDEEGPLWERRSREMAVRKETQATHATHLLRWAIGAIAIDQDGSTATVTTQETWEDRAGRDPPRVATVRVVYTLRRADAQAPWRLFDAVQTVL
jgi:hypothetical protein